MITFLETMTTERKHMKQYKSIKTKQPLAAQRQESESECDLKVEKSSDVKVYCAFFSTILHCTVEQLEHNNTFCPHCPQQAVGCAVVPSSAPYISFLFWAALSGTMLFSSRWFVTWVRTFTLWKGVVLWPQDLVLYSWLRLSTRVWGRAGR